jgi:type I site-specific restriction endonuclease
MNQRPAQRPNGSNEAPLPEHHLKAVEAGLAAAEHLKAERDTLSDKLHEANLKIEAMTIQLDSVKSVVNMMESTFLSSKAAMEDTMRIYREERDHAVTRCAELNSVLTSIQAVLHTAEPTPTLPVDEEQSDHV